MLMKFEREQKLQMLATIQATFEDQFGQSIGQLAAEEWLDAVLKGVYPIIYNQAIADAKTVLLDRMASLEDELYALQKPVRTNRTSR
ncbi:DUF2164 domain-containing protein [Paenibacillus sp. HJGM_3]|uniref:DUF2164 domain-containing protein n=1 Tax=Paenibacillus sp. HJGM_3 TaxID=3379816 RepID=UPI00385FBBD0